MVVVSGYALCANPTYLPPTRIGEGTVGRIGAATPRVIRQQCWPPIQTLLARQLQKVIQDMKMILEKLLFHRRQ